MKAYTSATWSIALKLSLYVTPRIFETATIGYMDLNSWTHPRNLCKIRQFLSSLAGRLEL